MRPTDGNGIRLVSVTVKPNTIAEDMLDLTKQALRTDSLAADDDLITEYIGAAIEAAENYLDKDILPRIYQVLWFAGNQLRIQCGRIRDLTVVTGTPSANDLPNLTIRGSYEFKGAGLVLMSPWYGFPPSPYYPIPDSFGKLVTFTAGFDAADDPNMPVAVRSFIYAMVGMLYENREIAGVATDARKYTMEEIPHWLLDPLKLEVVV